MKEKRVPIAAYVVEYEQLASGLDGCTPHFSLKRSGGGTWHVEVEAAKTFNSECGDLEGALVEVRMKMRQAVADQRNGINAKLAELYTAHQTATAPLRERLAYLNKLLEPASAGDIEPDE